MKYCIRHLTFAVCFVKVIDGPCVNGTSSDVELKASINARQSQNLPARDPKDTSESLSSHTVPLRSSGNSMMNHEDTLEVSGTPASTQETLIEATR